MSRESRVRLALRLEYFTIGYNVLEALAAIIFGFWVGSSALKGFGFDSLIETVSAVVLVWRLQKESKSFSEENLERIERKAERLVGITFFVLGAYVAGEAIHSLIHQKGPENSLPAIIIATLSILVMIPLARKKEQIAQEIKSDALRADATETWVCVYLSCILLAGAGLDKLFHWWWADSIASLVMVYFIVREGLEAIRGGAEPCKH